MMHSGMDIQHLKQATDSQSHSIFLGNLSYQSFFLNSARFTMFQAWEGKEFIVKVQLHLPPLRKFSITASLSPFPVHSNIYLPGQTHNSACHLDGAKSWREAADPFFFFTPFCLGKLESELTHHLCRDQLPSQFINLHATSSLFHHSDGSLCFPVRGCICILRICLKLTQR